MLADKNAALADCFESVGAPRARCSELLRQPCGADGIGLSGMLLSPTRIYMASSTQVTDLRFTIAQLGTFSVGCWATRGGGVVSSEGSYYV